MQQLRASHSKGVTTPQPVNEGTGEAAVTGTWKEREWRGSYQERDSATDFRGEESRRCMP